VDEGPEPAQREEARARARRRQRWESRGYYISFVVVLFLVFRFVEPWWLEIAVAAAAGVVLALLVRGGGWVVGRKHRQ
jgi:predicted MFS family arabinose efflux permease